MQASYEKNRKYARIPNPAPFRRTANAPVLRDGQSWPEEENRFPVLTDPCYSPHFSHMKANFHLNTDDKGRNVF